MQNPDYAPRPAIWKLKDKIQIPDSGSALSISAPVPIIHPNVLGKRPHLEYHLELLLPSTWFHMDMHSDGHACHDKFITYMINVRKGVI